MNLRLFLKRSRFKDLRDKDLIGKKNFYTILNSGTVLRLYQIYDTIRNEKMKTFLILLKDGKISEVSKDSILELLNYEDWKNILDLEEEEINDIKENLKNIDKKFSNKYFDDYKKLFISQRQGRLASFTGIQRKLVRFLRGVRKTKTLIEDEKLKELLKSTIHIYESITLRTNETKKLKDVFLEEKINLDRVDLKKLGTEKLCKLLTKFYDDYLSKRPDIFFGGIRTDKDLNYKVIGWYV